MPFRYDPTHWRARAEEMRRLAKDTKHHSLKQTMLRIADEYDELASKAAKAGPQEKSA
jgi:hypothetical protein